jgi:hypothetical protein
MNYLQMIEKTGKRRYGYLSMIQHLKGIENPLIVETGCAREEDNFAGDGMSSLIFDDYVTEHGGEFLTVDLDDKACEFAKQKLKTGKVHRGDSVKYLYELNKKLREENRYIDLLYLDSYDFEPNNPHPSCFHHIKELLAIMPSLRKGSMIGVDDNDLFEADVDGSGNLTKIVLGKGIYISHFFKDVGIDFHEGRMDYQFIWKL